MVLGHELAHIHRGDFANRLAGHFCVIVHFYHPIAHWLMARLRLEQELAADRWGIRLAGGRTKYLTTLARIALRHDAGRARGFDRSLLAFDSSFLRRIDVLDRDNALNGRWNRTPRRTRWMASASSVSSPSWRRHCATARAGRRPGLAGGERSPALPARCRGSVRPFASAGRSRGCIRVPAGLAGRQRGDSVALDLAPVFGRLPAWVCAGSQHGPRPRVNRAGDLRPVQGRPGDRALG